MCDERRGTLEDSLLKIQPHTKQLKLKYLGLNPPGLLESRLNATEQRLRLIIDYYFYFLKCL